MQRRRCGDEFDGGGVCQRWLAVLTRWRGEVDELPKEESSGAAAGERPMRWRGGDGARYAPFGPYVLRYLLSLVFFVLLLCGSGRADLGCFFFFFFLGSWRKKEEGSGKNEYVARGRSDWEVGAGSLLGLGD